MDDRRGWPINLVQRQGAVRHLLRHLKDGGQLMLATDQSAHHNPLDVPWFGRPAPTERAAAAIALRTGAPMLVSWCYRPPAGGSWQFGARLIEPGGPSRPVDDAALVELLGRAHAVLEGAIRRRPEQYLWIHDRYRTRT